MTITELHLRGIFDSRGEVTVEAELTLGSGHTGWGSCPRAIAPGRRERPLRGLAGLGPASETLHAELRGALLGREFANQSAFDATLAEVDAAVGVGAAVTLALSLAYARAAARAERQQLWEYVARLAGSPPGMPRLLVNVFSGGIHLRGATASYQQVMLMPRTGDLIEDVRIAGTVWSAAAEIVRSRFGEPQLSASSGLVVPVDSESQLTILAEAARQVGVSHSVSIGIDVAAEHLATRDGRYRLGSELLTADQLTVRLTRQAERFGLGYVEDPFDPADERAWRELRGRLPADSFVVGDDLFATDASRINGRLADGILLKLSQAGTVTRTLSAASAARSFGLVLAVSHRSGETEDTAMCDLAVALGAELIKIGGPRRGDRLAKYNQLVRLAERLPATIRPSKQGG